MSMYYCAVIAINILSAVFFHEHINISAMSGIPLFLIALTVFRRKSVRQKFFWTQVTAADIRMRKRYICCNMHPNR